MDEVLLMYSGGLDSILSMAKLVSQGYKVKLIHFDNGCSISIGLEVERAKRFEELFGEDKVEYVGKITTVPSFRDNEVLTANKSFSEIQNEYGDCTISQIRCLNCRSAMYYEAILYALNNNIKYIADGARKSQLFSIEQPELIDEFRDLLNSLGIELLLPVYDLEDDFEKENELFMYGILPSASEDQCVLGMPLDKPVCQEHTETAKNIFIKEIKPRYVKQLVKRNLPTQEVYKGNS